MNCVEFERDLPECIEGKPTPEQQAHLNSCAACSGLLLDLSAIVSQAGRLQANEEPSPSVWNALEARLRSEGLIRRSEPVPIAFPAKKSFLRSWRAAWLVPAAAALALVAGLKLYHPAGAGDNLPVVKQPTATSTVIAKAPLSHEDQQLLNTVAARPRAQLAQYRADLDKANSFIRDAQQSVQQDPNDIYSQQMLMNAYEQKQMLYELAVDRSGE